MRLAYNKHANDCGVRALAVVCDTDYLTAASVLARAGRPGCDWPVSLQQLHEAARLLDHRLVDAPELKRPTLRTTGRHITKDDGPVLIVTADHVAGVRDGVVVDWARNRLFRVTHVLRAERIM